jgi:hypothetical protein
MSLSTASILMLIDMVENRLSDMVVTDREDVKEQSTLRHTLQELAAMSLALERSARRKSALRRPALSGPFLEEGRLSA